MGGACHMSVAFFEDPKRSARDGEWLSMRRMRLGTCLIFIFGLAYEIFIPALFFKGIISPEYGYVFFRIGIALAMFMALMLVVYVTCMVPGSAHKKRD